MLRRLSPEFRGVAVGLRSLSATPYFYHIARNHYMTPLPDSSRYAARPPRLAQRCLAELVGTFMLVFFGCGAVHAAVLYGAQSGLWQVAIVWGIAIMLAAYTIGGISGCHINPAITIALACWKRFAAQDVFGYIVSQLAGAFLAAAALNLLFGPALTAKEQSKGVVRGEPGSVITASCYGEYYPNPGGLASSPGDFSLDEHRRLLDAFPLRTAFFAEVLGAALLALVVFAVTDGRNSAGPAERFAPVFIGLTVAALISVIAPLTQACFNPARDFGPRLFAYMAGWREVAIPGPNGAGWWSVYLVAPTLGALVGSTCYELLLRPSESRID